MPEPLQIDATVEAWPIAGEFVIARGAKSEATVVVAQVSDGDIRGRGECVPYGRYGETAPGVRSAIVARHRRADRAALLQDMPAGAARNALDCALWDYEAKKSGEGAMRIAGLSRLEALTTAYTISLGDPAGMAAKAAKAAQTMPLLKIKLGGPGDAERMRQIRAACPRVRLIGDANEAWTAALLPELMSVADETGFELIEQPLPAGHDEVLACIDRKVAVCADEALHTRADLERLRRSYDAVNIKLDKAGGLTEALALAAMARTLGFKIMVGCMVATSLAIAPAVLLARDREPALRYEGARLFPPSPDLWG